MSTFIRINASHLQPDHARTALSLARQVTKTTAKATLTKADTSGHYFVVIDDERQLKVFVGFLITASVRYEDRTSNPPKLSVTAKSPAPGPSKTVGDVMNDLLDLLSPLLKGR